MVAFAEVSGKLQRSSRSSPGSKGNGRERASQYHPFRHDWPLLCICTHVFLGETLEGTLGSY